MHSEQRRSGYSRLYAIEDAAWIWHPKWVRPADSIVRFENRFSLDARTDFVFHLSADQRYELFVDGEFVAIGPDRSEVEHWSFKSYRARLEPGEHTFEVTAWWLERPPTAQLTLRPGFIFRAEGPLEDVLNTGAGRWTATDMSAAWTFEDHPYRPQAMVGRRQVIDGERLDRLPSAVPPEIVGRPSTAREWGTVARDWRLCPSELPDQRSKNQRPGRVIAVFEGGLDAETPLQAGAFESARIAECEHLMRGDAPLVVPAGSSLSFMWDLGDYRCGYGSADLGPSEGASVELLWFEAPFRDPGSRVSKWKDDRREWAGKYLRGLSDEFRCSADNRREFRPLWWRSGNYVLVTIRTVKQPLAVYGLSIRETGYPIAVQSRFESDDSRHAAILGMAERAIANNVHETYFDCPHYEQLMYTGDTQVVVQTVAAMTADDRMTRRAIRMFDWSRKLHGTVNASYPASGQMIPTFPLYWIMMLHDYAHWRDDRALVRSALPGVRDTVNRFLEYRNADGLMDNPPGWVFFDTAPEWAETMYSPMDPDRPSGVFNLLFLYALGLAAEIEDAAGSREMADFCRREAEALRSAIREAFWAESAGLFADDVGRAAFSEHAQIMALLSGAASGRDADICFAAMLERAGSSANGFARAQTFWQHYLFTLYGRRGRGDLILGALDQWQRWIDLGFRTPPEMYEPTRSDCHAWGGHPIFHLRAGVAGIRPIAPWFGKVLVAPSIGNLKKVRASMPHPRGEVSVEIDVDGDKTRVEAALPEGITGTLQWKGEERELRGGRQEMVF